MDGLAERTGRRYGLVDYTGDPDAERVIVVMGSGGETRRETVRLPARGERVGVAQIRLYRPFPARELRGAAADACAGSRARPHQGAGRAGEPLFLDVLAALSDAHARAREQMPGRHRGALRPRPPRSSSPAMVAGDLREPGARAAKRRFTIGINDDVPASACGTTPTLDIEPPGPCGRCSSARLRRHVGANKNTIKILGDAGLAGAGLLRLRLQEVRLADDLAPALRPGADPTHRTWSRTPASSAATSTAS